MTGGPTNGATAILLMGYGSPSGPEDLPRYLAEVLGGHPPSPEMVDEYRRRYAMIGGSPQPKVLESLREKLERRLRETGTPLPVYLGTKHWAPHVSEVIPKMVADGHRRVIAIPLSPYASTWILEPYRRAIDRGIQNAAGGAKVELRSSWHLDPHLIGYWSRAIREELAHLSEPSSCVILSAHSLPRRLRERGDPYPELLTETATAIVSAAGLQRWAFSYQSAGNTTEPWLGPDLADVMSEWRERGARTQVVASFGFVFDHLETLYDLDVVIRRFAEEHGITYRRIPMPNASDDLVAALVDVATRPSANPLA